MINVPNKVKATVKGHLAALLLLTIMAPWAAAISFFPQKANAQSAGPTSAFCLTPLLSGRASGTAAIGVSAANVPITNAYLVAQAGVQGGAAESATIHDCVIKPVIILIAKTLLAQLTRSIVSWINNGFKGNPAFVTDLRGFLTNVADQVIGEFVYGSELAFLCSPFQLQVRIALALNYQPFSNQARCTLSGIVQNTQSAFTNFAAGGWPAWFALTTNPANNPYGAYLMSQSELSVRIANAQYTNTKLLDFGRGFFSFRQCTDSSGQNSVSYDPYNTSPSKNCQIVTPGAAIEGQLQNVLGSEVRQLELANDINSIISALVGQLIKQGLLALGGIKGLSAQSSQFGGSTALDLYVANAEGAEIQGRIDAGTAVTNNAINRAQQYLSIKQQTLNRVLDAELELNALIGCYDGKIASSSLSQLDADTANQRILQASTTLRGIVTPKKVALTAQIEQAQAGLDQAYQLQAQIQSATSADQLDSLSAQYMALTSSGVLPTEADVATAQKEQTDILAEIEPLIQDTHTKQSECFAFPQ